MRPTSGMYHSRPTDLVIRCIAVGLENAFELSQEPLRPIASATKRKSNTTLPPGDCIARGMLDGSYLGPRVSHIDWGFIRLNVTSVNQLSTHRGDHRDQHQQLADFEGPSKPRSLSRNMLCRCSGV